MRAILKGLNIHGISCYVPENYGLFGDELHLFGQTKESSEKLKRVMGYDRHHILARPTTFSEFSRVALEKFFQAHNVTPDSIDSLIVVCQSPDHYLPTNSAIIHGKFPFRKDCYCVDMPDGCAGFIRGLLEAGMLLNMTSSRTVLLICGDILSLKVSRKDRNSYPLMGDAVAITLLSYEESSEAEVEFNFDGSMWNAIQIPAGGFAMPSNEETRIENIDEDGNMRSLDHLVMQGREVFTFTQTTVIQFAHQFMKTAFDGRRPDYVFSHQPNKFILERIMKKLGISDERMVTDVVSRFGNSSSATIPLAMALQNRSGQLLKAPFQALLLGFGIGLTWAGMRLNNTSLAFCSITEVDL